MLLDPAKHLGDGLDGIFCKTRKGTYEINLPLIELVSAGRQLRIPVDRRLLVLVLELAMIASLAEWRKEKETACCLCRLAAYNKSAGGATAHLIATLQRNCRMIR